MLHDVQPVPLSPSKGKAKEKSRWQSDWWDFQLLVERTQRPLEWSQSSVIFTAHPTQPSVAARHFLSSKQFVLPSPAPVLTSPASYHPPTVISVEPKDEWLFAYFPGREGDGTACLWRRGTRVNDWNVKEWWAIPQGAGVVAASWLGAQREWVTDPSSGSSVCLPPRGPPTPISSPTLLLVTQDHTVNMYYYRHYFPNLQVVRCPLDKPGFAHEGRQQVRDETDVGKQCFMASIGVNHSDNSIMIATRSYIVPIPPANVSPIEDLDTTLSSNSDPQVQVQLQSMVYEALREEPLINLTEVQLRFNGTFMTILAEPLPPIADTFAFLASLNFITVHPSFPDLNRPPSPSKHEDKRGPFYLATVFLEFGDYTSAPKSDLVTYALSRHVNYNKSIWVYRQLAMRSFHPQVLTFVAPHSSISSRGSPLVCAGVVHTGGLLPRSPSSTKEIRTGEIRMLNLSDLTDSDEWETAPLMSPIDGIGTNIPLNTVVSPNGILMSILSAPLWPARTSVHTLPRRMDSSDERLSSLAARLSSAILSQRAAADVTHILSLPATPIADVLTILSRALQALETHQPGLSQPLILSSIGEVMAVYRRRSLSAPKDSREKEDLEARWKAAHDICSATACNLAFEDSEEGNTYDLDAVWQLISLSTWAVTFTECVMKECVLFSLCVKVENGGAPASDRPLTSSTLLHLVQPFALQKFSKMVTHVKQYRAYLGSLSAKGQNAQIARDILIDVVDNSGIDFSALEALLKSSLLEAKSLDKDDCLRALATCQPTQGMQLYLAKIIHQITKSNILHKPTLFLKPFDLVDDLEGISNTLKKNKDRDVILKRVLAGGQIPRTTCQRCGGQSEVAGDLNHEEQASPQWQAWEKMWRSRCICGGEWMRPEMR